MLTTEVEEILNSSTVPGEPKNLYDPIRYFLGLGGKRFRPSLVLFVHRLYGDHYLQDASRLATCIELFHNFTLIHDDIMDKATLRRNKETVHTKWNINQAILSGDALLIQAYDELAKVHAEILSKALVYFNETGRLVCEGQQIDMDFETRDQVDLKDYLEMIRLKTAVLIGESMRFAGLAARVSLEEQELLYKIGEEVGVLFQIQDDYLDVFGENKKFGKEIGGDIKAGKKTILFIKAVEKSEDKIAFKQLYDSNQQNKVERVKDFFIQLNIHEEILVEIQKRFTVIEEKINRLQLSQSQKSNLKAFFGKLLHRKS